MGLFAKLRNETQADLDARRAAKNAECNSVIEVLLDESLWPDPDDNCKAIWLEKQYPPISVFRILCRYDEALIKLGKFHISEVAQEVWFEEEQYRIYYDNLREKEAKQKEQAEQ